MTPDAKAAVERHDLSVQWEPIDSLTPWARNTNQHPQEQVERLARVIERHGWTNPVLVDRTGVVVAGHGRLLAAQHLGLESVPVIRLDAEGPEAEAIALGDNWLARLSEEDADALAELVADLDRIISEQDDLDIVLDDLGLDIDAIIGRDVGGGGPPADDDAPDVQPGPPDSALGGVYELGPHRLVCGDCADPNIRAAAGDGFDAVVTDPPYGIDASKMTMGSGESRKPAASRLSAVPKWDAEAPDVRWLLGIAPLVCVWGGNYLAGNLPVSDDWLIWHKKNDGRSFSEAELAWTNFGKRVRHLAHNWGGEKKQHITQKPVAVIVWCLRLAPGAEVIFDPFAGSGTTLMACAQEGRVARCIEIDPKYCDVIRRRYTRWAVENGMDPGTGALE